MASPGLGPNHSGVNLLRELASQGLWGQRVLNEIPTSPRTSYSLPQVAFTLTLNGNSLHPQPFKHLKTASMSLRLLLQASHPEA